MAFEKIGIANRCSCGGKTILVSLSGPYQLTWYRMGCLKCKAFVTAPSKEKTIERWNRMAEYVADK
jgi:hypothetical protein